MPENLQFIINFSVCMFSKKLQINISKFIIFQMQCLQTKPKEASTAGLVDLCSKIMTTECVRDLKSRPKPVPDLAEIRAEPGLYQN